MRWDPRLYLSLVSTRLREVLVNNSPRRYLAGFYPTEIYYRLWRGGGGGGHIYSYIVLFSLKKQLYPGIMRDDTSVSEESVNKGEIL